LPIGIAAGLLVRWGCSLWPPLMLGAVASQMATGHSLPGALLPGVSLVSGPLCLAWYLKRSGFRPDFSRSRDAARFGLAAAVALTLPPTLNLVGMAWLGVSSAIGHPVIRWLTWWAHATIGALLVAPILITLTWAAPRAWLRNAGTTLTLAALAALVLISTVMLPWEPAIEAPFQYLLRFWLNRSIAVLVCVPPFVAVMPAMLRDWARQPYTVLALLVPTAAVVATLAMSGAGRRSARPGPPRRAGNPSPPAAWPGSGSSRCCGWP
jgi:integral membrane sensor domain MASE1